MQATKGSLDKTLMILICVVLGFIALLGGDLFLLFFIPIVVYIVWTSRRKVDELQRRIAELEEQQKKTPGLGHDEEA